MPEQFEFAYNSKNFPFHDDYRWPHLAVCWGGDDVVLHVHCIRDEKRRLFSLMGFLDTDHVDQIVTVIHMAELNDAKVIMFRGVGFTDEIINQLMEGMGDLDPRAAPGAKVAHIPTPWPTNFQRKVLRHAYDMGRYGVDGEFHETSLAYRLHAPVEEIHQHLELLADLGLMEAAG